MGIATRLAALTVGSVAFFIPGGQAVSVGAFAFAFRPPDPIEIGIAATLHVGILL